MIWLLSCVESPQPLPSSRLDVPVQARMVEYAGLRSFVITKGEPEKAILWKTTALNEKTKNCAISQLPMNRTALLITSEDDLAIARSYLKRYTIVEEPLSCPEPQ